MKKFILAVCTAVILVSCGKQPDGPYGIGGGFKMGTSFVFTANFPYDARCIVGNDWAEGDVVFLFLKDITSGYLFMEYHEASSSFSVTPRGSIEMKDMLYNGRKLTGAVFMRQGTDVTATYADGKWSFSPVRHLPYFTAGESAYTFNQDGYGNYSFSGTVADFESSSPTFTYSMGIYMEEPSDGKYYKISELSTQPVPGIAAFGVDGKIYEGKTEAGEELDGLAYTSNGKSYRAYYGIHHTPAKTYSGGEEDGYGYLFQVHYGDHTVAYFKHSDTDYITNPFFQLPVRPKSDVSSGDGWWPFVAHGNDFAKEDGVNINGITWAVQNLGAKYPWETGTSVKYNDIEGKMDYANGWYLPSSYNEDFNSLIQGTTRYWTTIHGTPGYIIIDADKANKPFIFLPGNNEYTVDYWGRSWEEHQYEYWTTIMATTSSSLWTYTLKSAAERNQRTGGNVRAVKD